MNASMLKVGDRIRIIGVPGEGDPSYKLLTETKRVFKKLVARARSVRIFQIDEYGSPWYACRFKMKNGQWEHHWLAVYDREDNWVLVKPRIKR
jgi:hypothetical protein